MPIYVCYLFRSGDELDQRIASSLFHVKTTPWLHLQLVTFSFVSLSKRRSFFISFFFLLVLTACVWKEARKWKRETRERLGERETTLICRTTLPFSWGRSRRTLRGLPGWGTRIDRSSRRIAGMDFGSSCAGRQARLPMPSAPASGCRRGDPRGRPRRNSGRCWFRRWRRLRSP